MTTREAALKSCKDRLEHLENAPSHHYGKRQRQRAIELEKVKIEALRPVTREQVEKVWRGECDCSKSKACCTCCSMRCQDCIGQSEYRQAAFCMKCGRPLTDEAVDMVMERLEELRDE